MDQPSSLAVNLCRADACAVPAAPGVNLCDPHTHDLFVALTKVAALDADLEVTRSRQDQLQRPGGGGRSASTPLPFSWSGAETAWNLEHTLAAWSTYLAASLDLALDGDGHPVALAHQAVTPAPRHARGHVIAVPARTVERVDEATGKAVVEVVPARYHDDPAAIVAPPSLAVRAATWLTHRYTDLAALDAAGQALDEITHVVGLTRHAIDRAPARWFVGNCDLCGTAMYARPTTPAVICPNTSCVTEISPADCSVHVEAGEWCTTACEVTEAVVRRTRYDDVDDRRADMLAAAEDYLATAVEATAAVPVLAGVELNVNTLRQAARSRGGRPPELVADHTHPDGRARYRLGDVIALARRIALRHAG